MVKTILAAGPDTLPPKTLIELEKVFGKVLNAALSLAGIVLFIMLVLGGYKYITSGTDPKKAESAKKTLTSAILGLVLIAMAFLILTIINNFVFDETSRINFLDFKIYQNN